MRRKSIISLLILPVAAILSSCSSEDTLTNAARTDNMTFTVIQEGFANVDSMKTRTTDSGTSTTFSSGDAIGIYVVNGSSVPYANLKYTYDGSSWKNDTYGTSMPLISGGKYFAYYPYKNTYDASSVTAAATTAEAFFATIISGWTPASNQSTHDLYTSQDLMVSLSTASDSYIFNMKHQMALVEADFAQIRYSCYSSSVTQNKYVFNSTYSPYNISNGAYRLLVKPGTNYTIQGGIYNQVASAVGDWSIATGTTLTAGLFKSYKINGTSSASLTSTTVSPAVGDLYYNDGTYGPTYNTNKTPIGVVVSTNNSYCEPTSYGHGLVMALKDAASGVAWSTVNTDLSANLPFVSTVGDWKGQKSGLTYTNYIKTISGYTTTYPAFYKALTYSATIPSSGTSGWFLPSSGQWYEAMVNAQDYYNAKTGISPSIPYSSITDQTTIYHKIGSYANNCATEMNYIFILLSDKTKNSK